MDNEYKGNDMEKLSELAYFYADKGDLKKAIEMFEKIVKLDAEDSEAFYNLGVAYGKLAMEDIAKDELWEDKTDEEALFELAVKNYMNALELDPGNKHAHNNLGLLYETMEWTDKAVEEFEASLKIDPSQTDIEKLLKKLK